MAGNVIQSKRGVPGRKLYDSQKVIDKFGGMDEKEKLQSICAMITNADREQKIRRNTVHYLMSLYFQGYQNVQLDPGSSTFDVYEREDYYTENQFRHHVDAVVNMLSKNEGDVIARPQFGEPQDIAKARVAAPVLDIQKSEVGYEAVKHMKNLYKALFGTAFIFTDYIRDEKYGTIVTPKFDYKEIPDDGGGEPFLAKIPAGVKTTNRGRTISVVCSPLEVTVRADTKGWDNVPYVEWRSRQDNDLLNYMYPGLGLSGGSNTVDADLAQQYLEVLNNLPGNVLGDSLAYNRTSTAFKRSAYTRTWLKPCMYSFDKALLNKYPEGVHVAMVNGKVVDVYAEDLFKRWTYEVLIPLPHSLLGDGLYDALLMQDQINEVNSLLIQHLRYSTVGHKLFNPLVLDPENIVNDPKHGWIEAKPTMELDLNKAVAELHPQQLSQDVPAWKADLKTALQDMTSAYDQSVGKSLGANTPYSQSVFLTERAQSRWAGSAAYNRPQLIKYHENLLYIAQHEWLETRTLAVAANTGSWSFQEFSGADLCGNIDLYMSNTDFQPKSRAEQIQSMEMLMQLAPMIGALPPKQKLRIEEWMGLPPDSNPMNTQISKAYRHIDRITKGEIVTPMPFVDDPSIQLPVLFDYLASEHGEDLAKENQQAFADLFTFAMTMMHIMQGQAMLPYHGMAQPPGQGQQPQAAPGQKPPEDGKPPGGQPGQPGGGPQSTSPKAQTPVQPSPPISPAAAV